MTEVPADTMSAGETDEPFRGEGMAVIDLGEPDITGIAGAQAEAAIKATRVFQTGGRSLRSFAARGMLINTVFDVALQGLSLVRGFIIAALLTKADYGVWSVLATSVGVVYNVKVIGVSDKYIQQDEPDQELAFQHAFTMECLVTLGSMIPLLVTVPLAALVYGHWVVLLPGLAVVMSLPAMPFTASLWVYYRRMEFARARLLQALDPLTGFVVTIVLAIAGAGYWALVAGLLAGAYASAIGCWLRSPYKYRWRYHRSTMRVYVNFTWPILVASLSSVVLANSAGLAINHKLGLSGVGIVGLCATITGFTLSVDAIVSSTLYPAICAVQERLDLLRESFEKANRMALIWAMPFGVGVALFAQGLIQYGLGPKWEPAVSLLQITGVTVAIGHIGFNWDDYLRARAETKPVGVASVVTALSFVAVGVPLTLNYGLRGLGFGIAFQALVNLCFRAYYVKRLFRGFAFVRHALRAIALVVPATVGVLLVRLQNPHQHSIGLWLLELAFFLSIAATTIWAIERNLLLEAISYVVQRRRPSPA
jgi:O-antigen/teichoic acid export membrane protein